MKIYLATAIDQDRPSDLLRNQLGERLRTHPGTRWVFDPSSAFRVGKSARVDSSIREINRAALAEADVLVAYLPAGTVSVGVPMEIDRHLMEGKPAIVISDANSWMLDGPGVWRIHDPKEWGRELGPALEWARQATHSQGNFPFMRDHADARLPTRAHADDAGLDLYVLGDHEILPGSFKDIPSGIRCELPEWSWGLITGRSSTLRKRGLMVAQGVIDAGYRGELFAGVWNLTDEPVQVKHGERLAQLIVLSNSTMGLIPTEVHYLNPSLRGDKGFGSSGS